MSTPYTPAVPVRSQLSNWAYNLNIAQHLLHQARLYASRGPSKFPEAIDQFNQAMTYLTAIQSTLSSASLTIDLAMSQDQDPISEPVV